MYGVAPMLMTNGWERKVLDQVGSTTSMKSPKDWDLPKTKKKKLTAAHYGAIKIYKEAMGRKASNSEL